MTRSRSTRTPRSSLCIRNVNEALVDNNAKKKQRTQRQQYLRSYELELGLQPGSRTANGVVTKALSKFCTRFGREDDVVTHIVDPYRITCVLSKPKRKKTKTLKVFTSFRRDNITGHMTKQHQTNGPSFNSFRLTQLPDRHFFAQDDSIIPFLPTEAAFEFRVPIGVMNMLNLLFFELEEGGDVYVVPEGLVELEGGGCRITVTNRDQFEVIVRCVSSSVSYRSTAKLFQVFGYALGNMKLGRPNEQLVRQMVRYVAAINLTVFKVLLNCTWGFSVLVDGATHQSQGYLDVCNTFALRGASHNFHFLAIPTGDCAHTGETYADRVLNALRSVAGERVLLKLIGIATDGAATMLGCNRGFITRVKAACTALGGGSGIVANWSAATN